MYFESPKKEFEPVRLGSQPNWVLGQSLVKYNPSFVHTPHKLVQSRERKTSVLVKEKNKLLKTSYFCVFYLGLTLY